MIIQRRCLLGLLAGFLFLMFAYPVTGFGKEKDEEQGQYDVPSHVLTIFKENTHPNTSEDQEMIEPSKLTKEFMNGLEIPIENPNLIKLLNETSLRPSPIGVGYRGTIFIGRWPLNYKSDQTTVNWEYQKVNENEINNVGGDQTMLLHYDQREQTEIIGALTSKITNTNDVKHMILAKAKDQTNLPLSFRSVIGKNTRKDQSYNIPMNKSGTLKTYAPAVNEKGKVTFGEVYIELKGSKKSIVIKNVTKQEVGAWIPVQDHVSFSFELR